MGFPPLRLPVWFRDRDVRSLNAGRVKMASVKIVG